MWAAIFFSIIGIGLMEVILPVFSIQEALDSNKKWRPIEGRKLFFCGNGFCKKSSHDSYFQKKQISVYFSEDHAYGEF